MTSGDSAEVTQVCPSTDGAGEFMGIPCLDPGDVPSNNQIGFVMAFGVLMDAGRGNGASQHHMVCKIVRVAMTDKDKGVP